MTLISLEFLLFFLIILIMYYNLPDRYRKPLLLMVNMIFAFINGGLETLFFLAFSIISTWQGAIWIEKTRKKSVFIWIAAVNAGILAGMKYLGFISVTGNILTSIFHLPDRIPYVSVPAAAGVSFYTLQVLGYLTDVYWNIIPAEHDLITYAVYGSYFPQLMSGPVSRWEELGKNLNLIACDTGRTRVNFEYMAEGLQRILWGIFKKLVIAERLAAVVNEVYGNYRNYSGCAVIFAAAGFAFQLYADFSGYTDIVLGMSRMLGIGLPENFKAPFFAKSIGEFWQRWHITLGTWLRNYIFNPVLRSGVFERLRYHVNRRFGKKSANKTATFAGLAVLWFLAGLWHGGAWKFIIGSGLLQAFYMIGGKLLKPVFTKLVLLFHIHTDTFSYGLFLRARTFVLVCIGFNFFNAESAMAALQMLKSVLMISSYDYHEISYLISLLDWKNWMILMIALAILLVHDGMEEYYLQKNLEGQNVSSWFNRQNFIFRMLCCWLAVGMIVLSFNLSASEYIYMQF